MAESVNVTWDLLARDRASRVFNNVGNAAQRSEGKFSHLGSALAKFGKRSTLALGAVAVAGGAFGLKIAASNEQAQISFTTMLGSAKKASKFLHELQAFAAKTPFEFPELQKAASSLISAGFHAKQVIPIMTTLGDVTSGMGTGAEGVQRATIALQQMSAAGRITGEDLNQLRDAGVPVFDLLASATGKSKAQISALAQAGKLGKKEMDQLFKALETGGGGLKRFAGLMDKQSQSLTGLWSTFKDTLGQGLAKAIQPMIPTIKKALGKASVLIGDLLADIPGAVAKIKGFAAPIVAKIQAAVPDVKAAFSTWAGLAADAFSSVKVDVAPIVGQVAAGAKLAGTAVLTGIKLGLATGDWSALGSTLGAGLGVAFKAAVGGGSKIAEAFAGIDWLSLGKKAGAAAFPFVVGLATGILDAILPFVLKHPIAVAELALAIIPLGRVAGPLLKIAEKLGLPILPGVLRGVAKSGGLVEKAFRKIWRGAVAVAEHIAPDAVAAARGLGNKIAFAVFSWAVDFGAAAAKAGRSLIRGLISPFKGLVDRFFSMGVNAVQGLIRGIGSLAGKAAKAAGDMVEGAVKSAWDKIKPGSPSKVFTWLGETIPAGLAKGINHGGKKAITAMKDLLDNVKSKVSDLRQHARDIASSAADSVRGVLDVSAIGAAVETTTAGRSIINPVTGEVTQGSDVTTSTTPSASSVLSGFKTQAVAFAAALAKMARIGLAPALIAAVAAAGPAGLTAATALASESSAAVISDNASIAAINKAAGSAGRTALSVTDTPRQLKHMEKVEKQNQELLNVLRSGGELELSQRGQKVIVTIVRNADKADKRRK